MQSKTSFFSPAIYRKDLTRFAPLYLAYLGAWLVSLPLKLLSYRGDQSFDSLNVRDLTLRIAIESGTLLCMIYAVLVAMALHGWYYQSRSVNTLGAMPIRREAWSFTNLLTALTVSLVPHLITALLTWAAAASMGLSGLFAALEWSAIVSMLFLFFYALAAFCAAVVGQILALPVLYLLLNFTAIVVNIVCAEILSAFVYGLNSAATEFGLLSPVFYLCASPPVSREHVSEGSMKLLSVSFPHWGYLLGLSITALVLLALAFFLFQRRRMEAAGDLIAVKPLRPVFKYCFAVGCALVLGSLVAFLFFEGSSGPDLTVMILCLLAGGFVGYFAAEVLLKKTFRVFGRNWIGFGVLSACLVLGMLLMEFDAFGIERRIPSLDEVQALQISGGVYVLLDGKDGSEEDRAYLTDALALHQAIVEDKEAQEALARDSSDGVNSCWVDFTYTLQDGSRLQRVYNIYCDEALWQDKDSLPRRCDTLFNTPALRLRSIYPDFPLEGPQNIALAQFNCAEGDYIDMSLSQEDAYALYTTCIIPDLRDGKIGQRDFFGFGDLSSKEYDAVLHLQLIDLSKRIDLSQRTEDGVPSSEVWYSITPTTGSRTAQFLIDLGYPLKWTVDELEAMEKG